MNIKLLCCISLDYDIDLVYHFCKHYSKYNIDKFHFILHSKNFFEILDYKHFFYALDSDKITLDKWIGEFNAIDKIEKFNKIIENTKESHILLADVDEFQNHNLPIDQDYVWGSLVDREPKNTKVKKVTLENIETQFPIQSLVSGWKNNIKPCIFPSFERLSSSHYIKKIYNNEKTIQVDHYRWTDTRLEKSIERFDIYNKLNNLNKRFSSGYKLDTFDSKSIVNRLKKKSLL